MIGMVLITVFMCVNFSSCTKDENDNKNELLIGRWDEIEEKTNKVYHWKVFFADGTGDSYIYGECHEWFKWSISGNILTMTYFNYKGENNINKEEYNGGTTYKYTISTLNETYLILNYDEEGEITHKRHY